MIQNPILPGFNPDPSILRVGDDYYIASSTFEWFPGIAIYHSRNLKDWILQGHALNDEGQLNLSRLPSAKGIWAPCLTYDSAAGGSRPAAVAGRRQAVASRRPASSTSPTPSCIPTMLVILM
ncbi:hypothetical protein MASR2M78_24760 [Treponema sp.]